MVSCLWCVKGGKNATSSQVTGVSIVKYWRILCTTVQPGPFRHALPKPFFHLVMHHGSATERTLQLTVASVSSFVKASSVTSSQIIELAPMRTPTLWYGARR